MSAGWLLPAATGVTLRLWVTPRARRLAVGPVAEAADGPRLRVAVTAPPADGAANAAVLALLARRLDLPRSALTLVSGAGSRNKSVAVAADPARLRESLALLAAGREEAC